MATITITFAHPTLTRSEVLTVADDKLIEFLDLLRNKVYPQEGDPPAPLTRVQVATKYAQGFLEGCKETYKVQKRLERQAALPTDSIE